MRAALVAAQTFIRSAIPIKRDDPPWDVWGAHPRPNATLGQEQLARFDRLAGLTREPDGRFDALHALYLDDEQVRVPDKVFNAMTERLEVA